MSSFRFIVPGSITRESRKKLCAPVAESVTEFVLLVTVTALATSLQCIVVEMLDVDCATKPLLVTGQASCTFAPVAAMLNGGGGVAPVWDRAEIATPKTNNVEMSANKRIAVIPCPSNHNTPAPWQ